MYLPAHFRETDLARLDELAAHDSFGTLISIVDGAPFVTHMPVLYAREGNTVRLTGHWARENPQWRTFDSQRVLFIFHGPHAYISPRWYAQPARNVPTWNYAVAHVYGRASLIHEVEALVPIVDGLARKYEGRAEPAASTGSPQPWQLAESHPGNVRALTGVVGFELLADDVQLKFKLNQNHPAVNVEGAMGGLRALGGDDNEATAALMQAALVRRSQV